MTHSGRDVLTVVDLATYVKVPKSTVYKLAQEGKVPAQKVEKHWRFHKPAIDQWLADRSDDEIRGTTR